MVNKAIISRLMGNIEGYLHDLNAIENISLPQFKNDIISQRFTERTLQIIIEAMLDIVHHIISDEGLREPDSYADAFTVLCENKIIDEKFMGTLKQIAQFRNKLVHNYGQIDCEIVYNIAIKKKADIRKFIAGIATWMKNK